MRAIAIINARAGTVLEAGPGIADDIARKFREHGYDLELLLVAPEEIEASIRRAAARAAPRAGVRPAAGAPTCPAPRR